MASKPKHPPGDPMTLGNMRELRVQRLLVSRLNHACRHDALLNVSGYPAETEVWNLIYGADGYMSAAPDTSRSISKMRRNIASSIRRNSRMPIQVPPSTAGAHQRNVVTVSLPKMPSLEKYIRVATCMIKMNG
jgi:hypothetical protein